MRDFGDARIERFALAGAAITVGLFLWQVLWAVVTPPFQSPDEPLHFNSVMRMASTSEWPNPGEAYVDDNVLNAVWDSGFVASGNADFGFLSRRSIVGSVGYLVVPSYSDAAVVPHVQRASAVYSSTSSSGMVDQMTQHPPLFYGVMAGALNAVGGQDWPWDRQLVFLRVVSAACTLPVIPSVLFTARKLGLGEVPALLTGVSLFAVPQFAFNTGGLNNDSLAIGTGALAIASCSSAAFGRPTWKTAVVAGMALGLGLWTKGTFIPMGLVVGLCFLINSGSGTMRRRLRLALGAGSLALLLGAWWWVRNLIDFGVLQPAGYVGPHVSPGSDYWYFLISAARDISASSWGRLGWLDWNLSSVLVGALAAGSLVTVGFSEFFGTDRLRKLTLLSYYPLTIALLFLQALTKYREDGTVPGVQGRYLFPSIVALVVIAATTWWPVLEEAMSRWSRSLIALPGVVSFSIAVFAVWDWCRSCYPSESGRLGVDWVRWSLVAGFDISWLKILVILSLLGVACACTIPVVIYRRQHHVENTVTQPRVSEPVTG